MNEYTSAGLSGIHFGHLKSCAKDQFLSSFEASLAQIAFGSGTPAESWTTSVICMIKKKQQEEHISRLRSIVLTEADFNFNNKILGKLTLQVAEEKGAIAKEQYGSRKGRSSIDHALNKRLFYDIVRQSRRPAALCSNDAKSCYDRIVHTVAILAYRQLGIAHPPMECMIKTIQNMKHHFRTAHGDSIFYLENNTLIPFQGTLQGNGASPTTWVIISSVLLDMMRTLVFGGKFILPISGTSHSMVAFAYVDDTDIITFDMEKERTLEETMEKMQEAIQAWEGGLKATGGAIVPAKSWVYPIDFKFNQKGEWSYKSLEDIDTQFEVQDCNDQVQLLPQVEPMVGKETLGVYLSPDGNNKAAIKALNDKAKEWASLIKAGHLKRNLAWQAAETTILKSLQYPLPALTLSEKECNKIMQPVKAVALSRTSISRNFPLDVLYGPKEEGGLGLDHLYIMQGAMHLEKIQGHLGTKSLTGQLIQTSLEAAQLEIRIGRSIFELDYNEFGFLLTDCWIKHVWKFAYDKSIRIEDLHTPFPTLQRENDVFLMEIFHHEGYKRSKLININRCRVHLQVLTLSHVMNGYGDGFTSTYLGIKDDTRSSQYKWPQQPRPSSSSIRDWKLGLRKAFGLRNGRTSYQLDCWLHNDLRNWT